MKNTFPFSAALLLVAMASCSTPRETNTSAPFGQAIPHPLIIYKADAELQNLTPVTLSDDGSQITGYPAPSDLKHHGQLRTPTPLADDYWLDNRGIGPQTAFITLTYSQYASLPAAPSADELLKMIKASNAITEMWHCKRQSPDSLNTPYANQLIMKKRLHQECKRLK